MFTFEEFSLQRIVILPSAVSGPLDIEDLGLRLFYTILEPLKSSTWERSEWFSSVKNVFENSIKKYYYYWIHSKSIEVKTRKVKKEHFDRLILHILVHIKYFIIKFETF